MEYITKNKSSTMAADETENRRCFVSRMYKYNLCVQIFSKNKLACFIYCPLEGVSGCQTEVGKIFLYQFYFYFESL